MAVAPAEPQAATGAQFATAKSTLLIDRSMTWFITIGGLGVIIAVLGIFVFILSQIVPLFQGAGIQPLRTVATGVPSARVLGVDEWTALPMLVGADGTLSFIDLEGERGAFELQPAFEEERTFSAYAYDQQSQRVVFGTTQGEFALVDVNYPPFATGLRGLRYAEAGRRPAERGWRSPGSRRIDGTEADLAGHRRGCPQGHV